MMRPNLFLPCADCFSCALFLLYLPQGRIYIIIYVYMLDKLTSKRGASAMSYRLIVSDMDDTLLNKSGYLSEETVRAVTLARQNGAGFVLASGRMPCSMSIFAKQLSLTLPMICYNGSMLFDPVKEEAIHSFPIDVPLAKELIDFCEARALHIQCYEGNCFLTPTDDAVARGYLAALNDLPSMRITGRPLSQCELKPQPKMLLIDEPERIRKLLPVFQKQFEGRLICTVSRPKYIEFVSPHAGKERALAELCRRLSIAREEVLAFGDGLNDMGMIRYAGLGCAMANARAEVRACADLIAPPHDESGVAQVILQLLAEGRIGS